jgi:hypothetical protein
MTLQNPLSSKMAAEVKIAGSVGFARLREVGWEYSTQRRIHSGAMTIAYTIG